jgi:hypothetical protein
MNTVGEFKDELRTALKRGSSLDRQLGSYMRRASQWIEQNWTLQYMRRRVEIRLEAGMDSIPAPRRCKTVEGIKWDNVPSDYTFCVKRTFEMIERIPRSGLIPQQFYLDGATEIVFNGKASQDLHGQGMAVLYSDFPADDRDSHWLIVNAEELFLLQCIITSSVINRDERTWQMTKMQRDEAIKVALNADYEASYAGMDLILQA